LDRRSIWDRGANSEREKRLSIRRDDPGCPRTTKPRIWGAHCWPAGIIAPPESGQQKARSSHQELIRDLT
jgi:hypothetical protein